MVRLHDLDLVLLARVHARDRRDGYYDDETNELAAHDRGHPKLALTVLHGDRHVNQFQLVRAPHHECETDKEVAKPRVD